MPWLFFILGSRHRKLHLRQMHAVFGKKSTRRDTTSCQYVIKKESFPWARHGPSVRQCMHHKEYEMLKKVRKHKNGDYKNILDRWHNNDKYRKSLSDIGWTEERIIRDDEIALADHSYVATRQERSRNAKPGKLSLNAEGIQGPLNHRSDFLKRRSKYAKYCITTIQRSLEVEINLSLQSNQSDKSLINNLKALRKTIIDLKLLHNGDTILLPQRIHLRHHGDNHAATCGQLGAGIRGNHHPGLNSELCMSFRLPEIFSPGNRRGV